MSYGERETVFFHFLVLTKCVGGGGLDTRAASAANKDKRCQAGSKFEIQTDWRWTG